MRTFVLILFLVTISSTFADWTIEEKKEYAEIRAYEKMKVQHFYCLEKLWQKESRWETFAKNKKSWAYWIAQALPAKKMVWVADDYLTSPRTQIEWGLSYIQWRYRTPCNAWKHSKKYGWY